MQRNDFDWTTDRYQLSASLFAFSLLSSSFFSCIPSPFFRSSGLSSFSSLLSALPSLLFSPRSHLSCTRDCSCRPSYAPESKVQKLTSSSSSSSSRQQASRWEAGSCHVSPGETQPRATGVRAFAFGPEVSPCRSPSSRQRCDVM